MPPRNAELEAAILGGNVGIGEVDLPALRSFTVESGSLSSTELQEIAAARWPALTHLEIWFGDPNYGASGGGDDIAPILAGRGLSALHTLGLRNCPFADELVAALAGSQILSQLQALDLSMGNLSDRGVTTMLGATERFATSTGSISRTTRSPTRRGRPPGRSRARSRSERATIRIARSPATTSGVIAGTSPSASEVSSPVDGRWGQAPSRRRPLESPARTRWTSSISRRWRARARGTTAAPGSRRRNRHMNQPASFDPNLVTVDRARLACVGGGQAQQRAPGTDDEGPPQRTWGQLAREYGAACVQGAGQSMIYGGRPRNVRSGLKNAAMGCAMGVGMKAIEDVSGVLAPER